MNQKKKELEQNELANVMGDRIEKLKPHAFLLGVIGLGILAAVILVAWLINSNRSIESSRWQEFFLANSAQPQQLPDARTLENVANDNSGTAIASVSLLRSADIDLVNSLRRSTDDEAELNALLRRAKKNYQQVVDSNVDLNPLWKRRALHGLAYSCESLGELDAAKGYYQRLVDEAKDTPIYEMAVEGLARVSDPSAQTLLADFEAWKPANLAPGPGALPNRPQIDFPTDEELNPSAPPSQPPSFDEGDDGKVDDAPQPPPNEVDGDADSSDDESDDN